MPHVEGETKGCTNIFCINGRCLLKEYMESPSGATDRAAGWMGLANCNCPNRNELWQQYSQMILESGRALRGKEAANWARYLRSIGM
jgi:hypothetical protein